MEMMLLYLILIAIWPLINYLAANFYNLANYNDIFVIALTLILGAVLIHLAAKKVLKQSADRVILPLFLGTALCFGYANIHLGIVEKIIAPYNALYSMKASYIYFCIFISVVYFAWKISLRNIFRQASKIFVCVVFALSLMHLAKAMFENYKHTPATETKTETLLFQFHHKPNIYYILMDAYARQDTLKDFAGYDNELFLKKLEEKGGIVSRSAWSNYDLTTASLAATMDMSYHTCNDYGIIHSDLIARSLKGKNKVREILRQNGYYIINVPAFENEVGCYGNEDTCIHRPSFFETYQSFLLPTPFRYWLCPTTYVNLESVANIVGTITNKPKFVFIHIAQVHDAIFDESGKFLSVLIPSAAISKKYANARYIASIKVMNSKLLEFTDHIRAKDPASIIIIQADHGSRGLLTPLDIDYWGKLHSSYAVSNKKNNADFGIFTAIYLPNYDKNRYKEIKKYFSGSFTLVNTFRYIFAYLSDKKPVLLPEKSSSFCYKKGNINRQVN